MDLKTAFIRLVAEVTQRLSHAARGQGASSRGVSARFGGSDYQVSVLDSTFAAFVEAEELAEDLLVLLADGLTEERLVALPTQTVVKGLEAQALWGGQGDGPTRLSGSSR